MSIELTLPVSNETLRRAIELRMSDCYPAMSIANALGGTPSNSWAIARKYRLALLVEEAIDRGLPVAEFYDPVADKRFVDCKCYLRLRDEIGGKIGFPQ